MDTNTQSVLHNARTVHTVGPRSQELRPATKVISSLIKLGLLAGLAVVAWKGGSAFLSPSSDSQERTVKMAGVDGTSEPTVENLKPQRSRIRTEKDKAPIGQITTVLPEAVAVVTPAAPATAGAYKLAIDVKHTDTTPALAVKMWRAGQEFQAAALQAEGLELQPYYIEGDSTQPTIGVGYNIKMSINAIGRDKVRSELKQAGIDEANIVKLMDSKQAVSSQAKITVPQALALLDVATHRFRDSTRAAVGAGAYDKLPAHRQAALMWIDYNTNIHRRPQLLQAVRSNQTHRAIEEMETWITVHGKRIRSPNIVLAQAMYWSNEGLRLVVMNPSKIKRDAANDIVMWAPAASTAATANTDVPTVPANANIHITAGTVKNAEVSAPNSDPQDVIAAQVAASTRAQLAGLRNVRSSASQNQAPPQAPQSSQYAQDNVAPSGPEHQSSNTQRRNWLNARNVRQVGEEPAPSTSNSNGIR